MSIAGTIQRGHQEITIDFPLPEVKQAIMKVFENFPSKYKLRKNDINEVFNTYHFPVMNGINPAILDITLKDEGAAKTIISITATNATGSFGSNSILEGHIQDYLLVLGKILTGEPIEEVKKNVNTSGCMVFILLGIVISTLIIMNVL